MFARGRVERIAELVRDRDLISVERRDLFANLALKRSPPRLTWSGDMLEKTVILDGFLEDILDDRLASWLRSDATLAGRRGEPC